MLGLMKITRDDFLNRIQKKEKEMMMNEVSKTKEEVKKQTSKRSSSLQQGEYLLHARSRVLVNCLLIMTSRQVIRMSHRSLLLRLLPKKLPKKSQMAMFILTARTRR